HTYLGPIDHPEAIGQGMGDLPDVTYPDFVAIVKGFGIAARQVRQKSEVVDALREMIAHPGSYVLDVLVPYQEHVLPMIPAAGTGAGSTNSRNQGGAPARQTRGATQ